MLVSASHRPLVRAAHLAAATFGAFWGTWGSAVPRVRDQAGLDDARLGTALLFISAGALPAMLTTGRALDRWGLRCTAYVVPLLGVAGVATAAAADGFAALCVGLAVVGAASGAFDVAMNSVGGRAEQRSGRPIITRSQAVFSSFVVVSSLGAGAAYAGGAPVWAPFVAVALLSLLAGVAIRRALPGGATRAAAATPGGRLPLAPLLLVGVLGALAFASENAHQSWGAVYLEDVLATGPGLSAVAPAVFAGVVAVTRFAAAAVDPAHARAILVAGGAGTAAGTALLARAPSVPVALAGLVIAAAGTAALFPTLLSIVSRTVDESARGRATSIVTVVSYLGFLLGPVYVGLWAAGAGLRGAMLAVAALGLVLAALTRPLLTLSGHRGAR